MNIVSIIQARMNSTRLPGKVLMDICGKPSLERMIERIRCSNKIDKIIVATTDNLLDDPVDELCQKLGISTFRGDEKDVLGRFVGAAELTKSDAIVRLTADCPMIDAGVLDKVVSVYSDYDYDYVSNTIDRTYPDGLDVEVMSLDVLREADKNANNPFLREHVTPYITGRCPDMGMGNFKIYQVKYMVDFSHVRWTLDTKKDLEVIRSLISKLPEDYNWLQALSIATKNPKLLGV
jgi:spore coat polysaccharide biosynthesis protein SpsF